MPYEQSFVPCKVSYSMCNRTATRPAPVASGKAAGATAGADFGSAGSLAIGGSTLKREYRWHSRSFQAW
jgi:hypothetical protein